MIYDNLNQDPNGLRNVGLAAGAWLVLSHGYALWKGEAVREWLKKFPFHLGWGRGLLIVSAIWAWFLFKGLDIGIVAIPAMDMGEYFNLRPTIMTLIPIAAVLVGMFCEEFLSVRALGCFTLLAAVVPLDAAFLRVPLSRLLLVTPTYVALIAALFWIGMPYTLRDQITWATASAKRWNALCGVGVACGIAILACALTCW